MHLLPCSPRGTWLLAGTAWLALCAVGWLFVPVLPRATWVLPKNCRLIDLLADGRTLVTAEHDRGQTIRFWDIATGEQQGEVTGQQGDMVSDISVTPDRQAVAAVFRRVGPDRQVTDIQLRVFRPGDTSGRALPIPASTGWSSSPVLSPGAKLVARAYRLQGSANDSRVEVWDLVRNESVVSFPGWSPGTFSADGRFVTIITRRDDGAEKNRGRWVYGIGVVNVGERSLVPFDVNTATSLTPGSVSLAPKFLPGHPTLLAATAGADLVIWDAAAGREVARRTVPPWWTFTPDGADVLSVAALPGHWALSRLDWQSGTFRYQDRRIGSAGEQAYNGIRLSPDGRIAAIIFMNSHTGALLEWLQRKTGWRWLSGKPQPKLRLFDAADAALIAEIPGAGPSVFCPDGRSLVALHQEPTTGEERIIKVWDIPPRKPVGWFAAGAVLSAVPISWLARRRTRRLYQPKPS